MNNQNNKLFGLFARKNITKDDEFAEIPINFKGFFVMFFRKFWNLSNLSLVYSLINLPILFLLLGFGLREPVSVVSGSMASSFFGMWQISESVELSAIFPLISSFGVSYVSTTGTLICYGISMLFLISFGLSNAGAAYVIRGYNRGDPIFLMGDFFGAVKRNWKQAVIIGVLDILISVILVFDFVFWNSQSGFMNGILMYFALFLCVVYFFMRFYIYTIMITFDLSVYKIFKDAFLLSFLGFKRNFVALLGIIITLGLSIQIFFLLPPAGIILPIILTFGLLMFISGYASYPVIKKYMIDPYYVDGETCSDSDEEAVFEDRG